MLEGRVLREGGKVHLQLVAHTQVWHTEDRGQRPIEFGRFELILSPQNLEGCVLQDVNDLAVAKELDLMRDRPVGHRIPGDRNIPKC